MHNFRHDQTFIWRIYWIIFIGAFVKLIYMVQFCVLVRSSESPMSPSVLHYSDVIMTAMTSQITSLTTVCSIVCSGADQRKHQSSASMAFVRGIHQWPVNSPHKGPVTRKMFPFDYVIMKYTSVPIMLNYIRRMVYNCCCIDFNYVSIKHLTD